MNMRNAVEPRTLTTTVGKREIDNEFKTLKRKFYDIIEASVVESQQQGAKNLVRDAANDTWHTMLRFMGIEKEGEYRAKQETTAG